MKKIIQRVGILFLIFMIGIVIYFFNDQKQVKQETTVYSDLGEATLPVVYTEYEGMKINCLRGYMQEMGNKAARETISVLPESRLLNLQIKEYGNTITGIQYEIRNLEMDRLIERTEIKDWQSQDGITTAVLPIQNLIEKNEDYLLNLTVHTAEQEIHYYTRIMWTDNTYALDMLKFADNFSRKTMDYDTARELVIYLETDNKEDNSSLGHVNIRSSFNHLTWDGLDVEMEGEPELILKEFDGIMGQLQVKYRVRINEDDGSSSIVLTEDNYALRWNEQRIYLMNYERYADQLFTGESESFSGKRIVLGISNTENVCSKKSANSRYLAFTVNGNLWCYDQKEKIMTCVFSFLSQEDDGVRSGYDHHGVKILSVGDDGTIDFLVYGYMNRGTYEGKSGVACCRYEGESGKAEERFFIPAADSYASIEKSIQRLSYLNENQMIYLMLGGGVYGIDLNSNETLVVAQGLTEGSFAVSSDGSRFAWQEGQSLYNSKRIHVMDFDTAQKQEITGANGDYVRVLGFVGDDLIYGFAKPEDSWIVNGRMREMPLYAMYIADNQMNIESEYRKEGIYIGDVVTGDGRIHLKQYGSMGEDQYLYLGEDTIVCNQKVEEEPLKGIGWFASQGKGRQYFVKADFDIRGNEVKRRIPEAFSYENTSMLELGTVQASDMAGEQIFHAYSGGRYLGASRSFSKAVQMAYDKMGYVTDGNQHILWDRINRRPARNIKAPGEAAAKLLKNLDSFGEGGMYQDENLAVIDGGGCSLNQMLYFIDKGIPVVAYIGSGQYVLLSGYDSYNVTIFNPTTQESQKMGLTDAAVYFEGLQNDFVCGILVE